MDSLTTGKFLNYQVISYILEFKYVTSLWRNYLWIALYGKFFKSLNLYSNFGNFFLIQNYLSPIQKQGLSSYTHYTFFKARKFIRNFLLWKH